MVISSAQNQAVKNIRRQLKSKGEHAILEGPHLLEEALRRGLALAGVYMSPEFASRDEGSRLVARLSQPPTLIAAGVLAGLADADSPQGCIAIAHLPRAGVEALPRRVDGIYVYAERLQDPGNLGALARSAEAAGAVALALGPGSASANHPRALRASAGSLLRLPVATDVDYEDMSSYLAELRPRWVALDPAAGRDLYGATLVGALILALGAEGPGLSAQLREYATERITIPLAGGVESLNATVAAAVVLFELRRRRG